MQIAPEGHALLHCDPSVWEPASGFVPPPAVPPPPVVPVEVPDPAWPPTPDPIDVVPLGGVVESTVLSHATNRRQLSRPMATVLRIERIRQVSVSCVMPSIHPFRVILARNVG